MHPILLIPHYNRRELLERVLAALKQQTVPHFVLVIDNGSPDGSAELAEQLGADVMRLDRNYGFAYAVNRGIERGLNQGAEYIGIVNNDVVPAPDWLEKLMEQDAAFLCGKIVSESNTSILDGTFDLISSTGLPFRAGNGLPANLPIYNRPVEISSAPMTLVLFRREVFETIGLLDESYGSYLEDVDFGIRCALAEIRGRYVPEAVATHQGSATLGAWHPETIRLMSRNQVLLVAKHYPQNWFLRYGFGAVLGQMLWGLSVCLHGKGKSFFEGKKEGLRMWRTMRGNGDKRIIRVFDQQTSMLRTYASGWFQKVISWIS